MEDKSSSNWYALEVATTPEAREAVEYALMEAGALGTETSDEKEGQIGVSAYFDRLPEREQVREHLFDALRVYSLESAAVREMNFREVPDEDWLGEWKKNWQPVNVGERFTIAPPWSEIPEDSGRIVIRIEPGMAFGTGTHETTRLCLAAIERFFTGGSFLDVGTGTGILAIAAAKMFPDARIEACDTDAEAVEIARENARLNGVSEGVSFRVGTVDESTGSANLVCANLTADVIALVLPALIGATCGRLILCGILDSQSEMIIALIRNNGIQSPVEVLSDGEWVAIIV